MSGSSSLSGRAAFLHTRAIFQNKINAAEAGKPEVRGAKGDGAGTPPGAEQQSGLTTSKRSTSSVLNQTMMAMWEQKRGARGSGSKPPIAGLKRSNATRSKENLGAKRTKVAPGDQQDDAPADEGSSDADRKDDAGPLDAPGAKDDRTTADPESAFEGMKEPHPEGKSGLPTPPPSPSLSEMSLPSYHTGDPGTEIPALDGPPTPSEPSSPVASAAHAPSRPTGQAGVEAPAAANVSLGSSHLAPGGEPSPAATAQPLGGDAPKVEGGPAPKTEPKLPDVPASVPEAMVPDVKAEQQQVVSDLKAGKDPASTEKDSMGRMEQHLEKQMRMQEMQFTLQAKKEMMDILHNFIKSTIQSWKLSGQ